MLLDHNFGEWKRFFRAPIKSNAGLTMVQSFGEESLKHAIIMVYDRENGGLGVTGIAGPT